MFLVPGFSFLNSFYIENVTTAACCGEFTPLSGMPALFTLVRLFVLGGQSLEPKLRIGHVGSLKILY